MTRGSLALLLVLGPAFVALGTDAPAEPPPRPLPFYYDLYTFRGDAGLTTVVAAFAVPVGRLEERREEWAVRYGFDLTLVLADTVLKKVYRSDDSVTVRLPQSLSGDHLLHAHTEIQVPPSRNTVQRVVMTDATAPGIGQLYTSDFPVPDYGRAQLMLSDVALGLPEAVAGWRRGDATLALLPTSQFPESAFDVYYEIYNLPAGQPYATKISIERIDEGAGEDQSPVVLRFRGESPAGEDATVRELRGVESSLSRGRYRLTVVVTDEASGETVTSARTFRVRGWGPGVTMVPALPRASRPVRPDTAG